MISSIYYYHDLSDIYTSVVRNLNIKDESFFSSVKNFIELGDGYQDIKINFVTPLYELYKQTNKKEITTLLPPVRKLNDHLIKVTQARNLDEYFSETGTSVSPEWAYLCRLTGYEVSEEYIS